MKLLRLLLLGLLAGLVWWPSVCPVSAVSVVELPCGRSDGALLCVNSFAEAIINTMSADSVILIYPGTYDFTEANPVYVLASDRLNITHVPSFFLLFTGLIVRLWLTEARERSGLGEPGSVVVNASGQALRLSGAGVTMTNVTVLGGLDVRGSASLTRVIVDSSGFDRHGIKVTNTTLLTMDSVTVTSGATADTHAIYAERSHISAVGPLTAHASGAGSHGIHQVSGNTNCASTLTIRAEEGDGFLLQAETGSTQTFTVGGSLEIEAGLLAINTSGVIVKVLGSADVSSNGSYAAEASALGTVEFLNERPNVFNANKQFLMAQDGTIVLRHVLSNLTFDCDGGTISSVPYSHVVSPAVEAVCTVNRLAVVLLGDEDEVVIASNTEQQGLVMSRVDVNVSQVTFVNFQYYDEIDTFPISFKTCFFYLGHSLSPGVFDCPLFLERPGWRVTFPVDYQYLTGLGRTTVRAVSGPEVQPPAEPVIYSNQSELVPLALQLNASSPILDIIPSATDSKANVAFGNIQEVTPLGEVVCTADIQVTGKWAEKANSSSSAFQTFGFSSPLFAGAQSNTTRIEMEFTLFKAADNVTYAPSSSSFSSSFFSNYSFAIDPSLAKFSLSLLSWPWSATNNTLRVKINIRPAFTDHRALAGVPQPRMTTLELLGQPDVQTNVRLVEFAFNTTHELPVAFAADPSDSTVVLNFPYFGAYLYYDPDFSLLVGHREESGSGGGGDTALVVAVAVVVPAAVLLVLLVLASATAVAWWRRRQSAARSLGHQLRRPRGRPGQ